MAQQKQQGTTMKFRVEGKEYEAIGVDDLVLAEIEEVEEALDTAWDDIDWNRARPLRWLLFLTLRRKNPEVTYDDLGQIKVVDLLDNVAASENGVEPKRPTRARKASE